MKIQSGGKGRNVELLVDGTSAGMATFNKITGNIYVAEKGLSFGDTWGWKFQGHLHSLAIAPSDVASVRFRKVKLKKAGSSASKPRSRPNVPKPVKSPANNGVTKRAQGKASAPPATKPDKSVSRHLKTEKKTLTASTTSHVSRKRVSLARAKTQRWFQTEKKTAIKRTSKKDHEVVPYSAEFAAIVNSGFVLEIVTTPNYERRPFSHCPFKLGANPRRASEPGFSVGHRKSDSFIEVRLADGKQLYTHTFKHADKPLHKACNRTFMLGRIDESTRVLNIWVDGERIAEDVEIEVGGDIVRVGGAGIFNNVWGWRFSGSLDSVTLRRMLNGLAPKSNENQDDPRAKESKQGSVESSKKKQPSPGKDKAAKKVVAARQNGTSKLDTSAASKKTEDKVPQKHSDRMCIFSSRTCCLIPPFIYFLCVASFIFTSTNIHSLLLRLGSRQDDYSYRYDRIGMQTFNGPQLPGQLQNTGLSNSEVLHPEM